MVNWLEAAWLKIVIMINIARLCCLCSSLYMWIYIYIYIYYMTGSLCMCVCVCVCVFWKIDNALAQVLYISFSIIHQGTHQQHYRTLYDQTGRRMNGQTDGRTDRRTDGRTDGRTGGYIIIILDLTANNSVNKLNKYRTAINIFTLYFQNKI